MKKKVVNFTAFNKIYPIQLSLFNKHSDFFTPKKIQEITESELYLELFDEFDFSSAHSEESITLFLQYCQDHPIKLTINNVISIQFLSNKFLVTDLKKESENFIEYHYKEIIEQYLTNKKEILPIIEKLISNHFMEYSNDDRLFSMPISTLCRIEELFWINEEPETRNDANLRKKSIIDFLIKTVIFINNDSKIFIEKIKFDQELISYFLEQMNNLGEEKSKLIFEKFLVSNPSFILEYIEKNKKVTSEKFKNYEKQIEDLRKEKEELRVEFEDKMKMMNEESENRIKKV